MNVLRNIKCFNDSTIPIPHIALRSFFAFRTFCQKIGNNEKPLFFNDEVQQLLTNLIRIDYEKVFQARKVGNSLTTPDLKFMTSEELEKAQKEAYKKLKHKLQMPPVLPPRKEIDVILEKDEKLTGFSKSKYIFTDISYGKNDRNRIIVVREIDGTLRKATMQERERSNEIYFPVPGRKLRVPQMFKPGYFEDVLNKGWFEFILERACIQFEPDDSRYISITNATYDRILETKSFQDLESTRHFGSMIYYYTEKEQLAPLLIYYLTYGRLDDVITVIKLHNIIHPSKKCSVSATSENELAVLKAFVAECYPNNPELDLSVKSYEEYISQPKSRAAV